MILLDTCALLWLAHKQENLSQKTLKMIENESIVYLSAISGFEICLKYHSGKLSLPVPPKTWFESVIAHHDISILDLNLDICIEASELPLIHKDPCDRFIIATAKIKHLPVVTTDSIFEKYGVMILN